MKEIPFRLIDRLFIKMSINDKFWVIFVLFFAALTTTALGRYNQAITAIEKNSVEIIQAKVNGIALAIAPDSKVSIPNISISNASTNASFKNSSITASARIANGQYATLTEQVPASVGTAKEAALNSFLLSFLWLIPIAIVLYWTATFLTGALWVLWQTTVKIADGDLTSRLGFHSGRDEFGTIGCALDEAMDTLTELVEVVKESSTTLEMTTATFASEVTQSQKQINFQHSSLDSVATAMEEMTASALEVSNIAKQAAEHSENDEKYVQASQQRVQQAISEIEQLSQFISESSTSVATLADSTTQINDVITTISAISEQTNLLALNAAIEAARAGEYGRGFAVVADEVRTLASRTQEATVEIQSTIEKLQVETGLIASKTENTVSQANTSNKIISSIGDDVVSIAESARAVMDMSVHISTSADEQSTVANDIASELSDIRSQSDVIREVAQTSAQGVSELTEASSKLNSVLKGYKTA